jgi:hypothetical protein
MLTRYVEKQKTIMSIVAAYANVRIPRSLAVPAPKLLSFEISFPKICMTRYCAPHRSKSSALLKRSGGMIMGDKKRSIPNAREILNMKNSANSSGLEILGDGQKSESIWPNTRAKPADSQKHKENTNTEFRQGANSHVAIAVDRPTRSICIDIG